VPLVRREDSVLVVVDAQPGFFAPSDGLSDDDAQRAADAVTRITWMTGLAALLDIPAAALGTPPWRL
jgi:nicotinamidase-related amidase